MANVLSLARKFAKFNGIFIGTLFGLVIYMLWTGNNLTNVEGFLAAVDIIVIVVAAAGSEWALNAIGKRPFPAILSGILGGVVAVPIAIVIPPGLSLPLKALGGVIAGIVVYHLPKFI